MSRIYRSSKVCPTCHRDLPIDEFYKNKNTIDGADTLCKEDRRAYNARAKARKLAEAAPQLVTA